MSDMIPMDAAAKMPQRGAGQATMVEQSRAIAEVQAAVVVAQNRPRSISAAMAEMRQVCAIKAMAERAFFKFNRGGQVTGETVHLARELARIWGNVTFGIAEMSRDDGKGQSEMLAFAWDLQTNARSQTSFIVPHVRDTSSGPKALRDMRDIYENNANMGARRLREQIFAVLPVWFREEAADICRYTLEHGGGVPLVKRIADCLAVLEGIGVTREQIARKIGRAPDNMTAQDVANLGISFKSIQRGEVSREEEFPREAPQVEGKPEELAKPASKLDVLAGTAEPTPPIAQTEPSGPAQDDPAQNDVNTLLSAIQKCRTPKILSDMQGPEALGPVLERLKEGAPELYAQVMQQIEARRVALLAAAAPKDKE